MCNKVEQHGGSEKTKSFLVTTLERCVDVGNPDSWAQRRIDDRQMFEPDVRFNFFVGYWQHCSRQNITPKCQSLINDKYFFKIW